MRADPEIHWILEGKSPDQIPMARLAEYMQQFAVMLGEVDDVRFVRVDKACTQLVAKVRMGRAAQRVQSRVYAVRDRRAPAPAMNAYRRLGYMVREDKGTARVTFGSAAILRFTSGEAQSAETISIVDQTTVVGRLYALIEEPNGTVKARIRPQNGDKYISCTADGAVAKDLGKYFMDAVRLFGRGNWTRTENEEWVCDNLHILKVDPVKEVSLREAINALRAIEAHWPDDPLGDWAEMEEKGSAA
jgi:hypothetical protein